MFRYRKRPGPGDETQERAVIDASRELYEMQRDAIGHIVPGAEDKEERIDLITVLSGRRPNMYKLFRASAHQEGLIALSHGECPNMEELDLIRFLRLHAPSLDALRSKQVVEIAQGPPNPPGPSQWLDWFRPRRRNP